jgi:hypothetical protein
MKKIIIVRADNSIEEKRLRGSEIATKLADSIAQHDINENLTMWVFTDSEDAGYNSIANEVYADNRGMNESFFYGEVVFTGKATLSEVFELDDEGANLIHTYSKKESN